MPESTNGQINKGLDTIIIICSIESKRCSLGVTSSRFNSTFTISLTLKVLGYDYLIEGAYSMCFIFRRNLLVNNCKQVDVVWVTL